MFSLKQISLLLVLTSCTSVVSTKLTPSYIPQDWKWESAHVPLPQVEEWWYIFNDPVLNGLQQEALASSPTLDLALYKVEQARAQYVHSWADLFPNLTIEPYFMENGQLFQNPIPIPGIPTAFRFHQQTYQVPFKLYDEIDLFNRLYYRSKGNYDSFEAQKAAFYTARLLLTTEIATTYFTLKADIAKIHIVEKTIQRREEAYEVNKARFDAGQVNYTDVSQADFLRQRAQVDLRTLQEDKALQENKLVRLTTVFDLPSIDGLKGDPPKVPAGIPSELLLRRPDIIDAQYQMLAGKEQIKSAQAALFPTFQFTGFLGQSSPDFRHIFDWIARFWQWQLQVTQTIFDFGRKFSDIDLAKSEFMQAVSNYREIVLEAIQEVEDALSGIKLTAEEIFYIKKSIEAAQISIDLFQERYLKGLVNYLEVVNSEENLLSAQQNEVDALLRSHLATVNLVKAIGGDFTNLPDPYTFPDPQPCDPDPQSCDETTPEPKKSQEKEKNKEEVTADKNISPSEKEKKQSIENQ